MLSFVAGIVWASRNQNRNVHHLQLERRLKELSTLHAFSTASTNATSIDALIESMTRIVGESITPHYFGILMVEDGFLREHASYNHDPDKRNIERIKVRLDQGVIGGVATSGNPVRDGDVNNNPVYLGFGSDTKSELAVPIRIGGGGDIVGVINAESTLLDAFTQEDESLLVTLANQLGITMEKVRLFEEVQLMATTDLLTNLPNRRHILEFAGREFDRANRYGHALSILMIDVDHFKRCNDTYGHAIGDEVLKEVGARSKKVLRESDLIGRYGGEEFLAILPETDSKGARHNAERFCHAFSNQAIDTSTGALSTTVSIGIATYPIDCNSIESLINLADQALYDAKASGRNAYHLYDSSTRSSIKTN